MGLDAGTVEAKSPRTWGGYKNLMGYYSWGSNDLKFDKRAYNSLGFAPGGIAETAVSTSARTFADPKRPVNLSSPIWSRRE